ncbi:DUF1326 domain-containing protein [Streptomyces sp. NPDC040750]|uniref:DUF1326 domain-containing protein n=1 Tax=Streptomyces sp. NPDC040750 TaxID=3154491 RepID=UPI0033F0945B
MCPCTTSGLTAPADHERCQVTFAFHVDMDGVDVSGRSVAVFIDAPRVMADGGWKVALYLDAEADPGQAEALGKVFSGQADGPMAALTPLIGEVLGVESAPIDYRDDGRRHAARVGDAIDIEIEDQVAPQFGEDGPVMSLTGMFHPANSTLAIARSTRATGDGVYGRSWDFSGGNGHSASFTWAA